MTISKKYFNGQQIEKVCNNSGKVKVTAGAKHLKATNIETGEVVMFCNREMGTGLALKIIKTLIRWGVIFPTFLALVVYYFWNYCPDWAYDLYLRIFS